MTESGARAAQYALQVAQVVMVGLTVGATRTALPALAEVEFHLAPRAPALLASIVVAFGVVKACMNFAAGALADRLGRRRVLILGWLVAAPIPFLLRFGPTWWWIIAAAALLGVNQGLTWSMTLTSKLDLTRPERRGLTNGINEFAGYGGVALAGLLTAWLAQTLGARSALFWFTLVVIGVALLSAALFARDTRPDFSGAGGTPATEQPPAQDAQLRRTLDLRMLAVCQAGLVEKFVDAFVWLAVPTLLVARGASVARVGAIAGVYGGVWGAAQLLAGPLSDRIGRRPLIAWGMLLCGAGVAVIGWAGADHSRWVAGAALAGLGMAALYPTLGASVSDLAPPSSRGVALGLYRFWRDMGYAIGALAIGLTARWASWDASCWLVAACMGASALVYLAIGAETAPLRRATSQAPTP